MLPIDPSCGREPAARSCPLPRLTAPRSVPPAPTASVTVAVAGCLAGVLALLAGPASAAGQGTPGEGEATGRAGLGDTVPRVDPIRLPALTVRAPRPDRSGKMRGFDRRRRLHPAGIFVGRKEIERRDPRRVSDLLRGLGGVTPVRPGGGPGHPRVRMDRTPRLPGRRACRVRFYLDGQPLPKDGGFRIDALAPEEVEGIEIYRGISEAPPKFQRRSDRCGVVVIWTRDPSGGQRR